MRTRYLLPCVVLMAAGGLGACADGIVSADRPFQDAERPAPLDPALASLVAAQGFRTEGAYLEGDHVVVEGDIRLHRDALSRPALNLTPGEGPAHQWHTHALVSQSVMASGIRVDLSGLSGNAGWLAAAREAIRVYTNSYNTKIHVTEGGSPHIVFSLQSSLQNGAIGIADFPSGGLPGPTIRVSAQHNSLSTSQKTWVMVHEIGHAIGYRHSNWQVTGEINHPDHYTIGANFIPGTLQNDPGSVMRGAIGAQSWTGFTWYDHLANLYVYPGGDPVVQSEGYNGQQRYAFTWASIPNVAQYQVYYVYKYDECIYDPWYPEGCWWHTETVSEYLGSTTGTSFTDPYPPRNQTGWAYDCAYHVYGQFPSGKLTHNGSAAAYVTC